MRICSGAGCLRAVADDVRFCDECKPHTADSTDGIRIHTLTDREKYAFLYSSTRWQRVRDVVVRAHPFCDLCHRRVTGIIDHRVPAGVAVQQARDSGLYLDKWAGFFLRSNLQALCRVCHIQKTIDDKTHSGTWPDVVSTDQHKQRRAWSF